MLRQRQLHQIAHAGCNGLQQAIHLRCAGLVQRHRAYIGQRQQHGTRLGLGHVNAFIAPVLHQPVHKSAGLRQLYTGFADGRLLRRHADTPCAWRRSNAAVASQQPTAIAVAMANRPENWNCLAINPPAMELSI